MTAEEGWKDDTGGGRATWEYVTLLGKRILALMRIWGRVAGEDITLERRFDEAILAWNEMWSRTIAKAKYMGETLKPEQGGREEMQRRV